MTQPRILPIYFLTAWLAGALATSTLPTSTCLADSATEPVLVRLKPQAHVTDAIVRVEDIADVTGGAIGLRLQIAHLDLDELTSEPAHAEIPQRRVALRLQWAGIATDQFVISGASATSVNRAHQTLDDERLLEAIRDPLAAAWKVPPETVHLRLTQPLSRVLPNGLDLPNGFRLSPFLPPNLRPGSRRLTVGVYAGDELIETFSIGVTSSIHRPVAVARRPIRGGDVLSTENVRIERRELKGSSALDVAAQEALGQFATRSIPIGRTLMLRDLRAEAPRAPSQRGRAVPARPSVRARSPVSLVARHGRLRFVYRNAILTHSAQVGDLVEARNLDSRQPVFGRLISPNVVDVSWDTSAN